MTILYEDNHLLIVSKAAGDIVQGDKTGDRTLADMAAPPGPPCERLRRPGAHQ